MNQTMIAQGGIQAADAKLETDIKALDDPKPY